VFTSIFLSGCSSNETTDKTLNETTTENEIELFYYAGPQYVNLNVDGIYEFENPESNLMIVEFEMYQDASYFSMTYYDREKNDFVKFYKQFVLLPNEKVYFKLIKNVEYEYTAQSFSIDKRINVKGVTQIPK